MRQDIIGDHDYFNMLWHKDVDRIPENIMTMHGGSFFRNYHGLEDSWFTKQRLKCYTSEFEEHFET